MQVKSFYRYRWDFCFDEDSSGKFRFVWAFLIILFFWWHTEAWQGSWETFSLCMRCSEVIISATQCVKSAATPCQNVLFRFSTVHFVTPSTPPPDQDLWITKYRAGKVLSLSCRLIYCGRFIRLGHRICLTFACCVCSLLYLNDSDHVKAKVEVTMMIRQRWNIICAAPRSLPKSFLTCLNLSSTFNQPDV